MVTGQKSIFKFKMWTTLTYDIYQPLNNINEHDVIVAVRLGIRNLSESIYTRSFVHWSQCHGYRISVFNHVEALSSVSSVFGYRIFTYGNTSG